MNHWAISYLGRPWSKGGQAPAAFNCWELVRHIQHAYFAIEVPEIAVDTDNLRACIEAFNGHDERSHWALITGAPQGGDCVLMSQGTAPTHIGIWLDMDGGGVLHAVKKPGVIFSRAEHLAQLGYHVLGVYRYAR